MIARLLDSLVKRAQRLKKGIKEAVAIGFACFVVCFLIWFLIEAILVAHGWVVGIVKFAPGVFAWLWDVLTDRHFWWCLGAICLYEFHCWRRNNDFRKIVKEMIDYCR